MDDSGINPPAAGQPGRHDQARDAAMELSNEPRPDTDQPDADRSDSRSADSDRPDTWPPFVGDAEPFVPDDGPDRLSDGDFGHAPEADEPAPWPPIVADPPAGGDTPPQGWPPAAAGTDSGQPTADPQPTSSAPLPTSPAPQPTSSAPLPTSPAPSAVPEEPAAWPPEVGEAHSTWAPFPSAPQHSPGAWEAYPEQQPAPPNHGNGAAPQQAADSETAAWPVEDSWPLLPEPPAIDPFGPPPGPQQPHQPPAAQQPPPQAPHQPPLQPQQQVPPPQQTSNGGPGAPQPQPTQPPPPRYEQPPQQPPQSWQPAPQQPAPPPQQSYQQYQPQPTPAPQWQPNMEMLGGDHAPTADDFAQRRAARPPEPVANQGVRKAVRVGSMGLLKMGPGRKEQEQRHAVEMVRRNFGGLRQITVINPKGGAGKTVAVLMIAMTLGQKRGGYVLAWDNNETQGTLGMRAAQDFHNRTVRDLLRDLSHFRGPTGRVGDLSQYVRSQGEAMFDVLASDESATAGEMLTALAFVDIRDVVSRFYKLIVVDTGNNVRAANWQAAIDATDQLVVCMSARNDSAETAARALDHLEQTGRHDLVRRAVTVVSMPAHRKDLDLPAVQRHFSARTRAVLLAPYEKLLDSGEPIRYGGLSQASRDAWLKIAASVAEGL